MQPSVDAVVQERPESRNRLWAALDRIGVTPAGVLVIAALLLLPLIPPFNQEHILRWLVSAALLGARAIAFDFTTGYINVVNFGFAAFFGVGAYTSGLLAVNLGVSPWAGIFLAAIPAGIIGFFLGLLTLRLRGIFAAVMAWFVGLALLGITRNLVDLTRGPMGLSTPRLLDTSSNLPYFYIIVGMMLVTYFVLKLIVNSHFGLAFRAIGQNFEAAEASGINPTFYRVFNFTVQCLFAGWLGGFYAHYFGILTPAIMLTSHTVEVLAIAYIGGRGSLWGGALIAFPFIFFIESLRSNLTGLPGLHLVIYGMLLIVVMIFYPGGFAQFYNDVADRLWRNRGNNNAAATSS
ncbi:MAG TPA: branched-chain amino acid ABC transporter permease [Candidatus Sulfomarinibacteraceae bacterium]|nr:branched-chain amino acid ABC transporter permease [Candidatus Sulfomarinibacteraceae bacterium]